MAAAAPRHPAAMLERCRWTDRALRWRCDPSKLFLWVPPLAMAPARRIPTVGLACWAARGACLDPVLNPPRLGQTLVGAAAAHLGCRFRRGLWRGQGKKEQPADAIETWTPRAAKERARISGSDHCYFHPFSDVLDRASQAHDDQQRVLQRQMLMLGGRAPERDQRGRCPNSKMRLETIQP